MNRHMKKGSRATTTVRSFSQEGQGTIEGCRKVLELELTKSWCCVWKYHDSSGFLSVIFYCLIELTNNFFMTFKI